MYLVLQTHSKKTFSILLSIAYHTVLVLKWGLHTHRNRYILYTGDTYYGLVTFTLFISIVVMNQELQYFLKYVILLKCILYVFNNFITNNQNIKLNY